MHRITHVLLTILVALSAVAAHSDEPQSFSASVDGAAYAGDDDTILFVPLSSGEFSLIVATAGAAAYPPPKTPIDRLSINCSGFEPGKTLKLDSKDFSLSSCYATFTRGADGSEFSLDKGAAANQFEITSAHGKVIEGTFELHFKSNAGATMTISNGKFVVEDRQI